MTQVCVGCHEMWVSDGLRPSDDACNLSYLGCSGFRDELNESGKN